MKTLLTTYISFAFVLAGAPAWALEPIVLYDDFKGGRHGFLRGAPIDPAKWRGTGLFEDEALNVAREIRFNRLRLMDRTHAQDTTSNSGRNRTAIRVAFPDPGAVTAMQTTARVTKLKLVGCVANSSASRARGPRLSGFFFNDGRAGPGHIGDLLASINALRQSSDLAPPGVLQVVAGLFLCGDADCSGGSSIGPTLDLGPLRVHQKVTLRIQWDEAGDQFIFQRDHGPAAVISYSGLVPNAGPPSSPGKRVGVSNRAANCDLSIDVPRPTALIEVWFDNVFVNESAVP